MPRPLLLCCVMAVLGGYLCTATAQDNTVAVRFSTYLGGSGAETGIVLATDREGNLYVAGVTTSPDFPVRNPAFTYQGGTFAGTDVFLVKLSPDGALRYATYLGGRDDELVTDLAVDAMGRAYLVGATASDDFPTRNAPYPYQSGTFYRADGFLARLSADGSALEFATYLGGTGDDLLTSLALDATGRVYVAGTTSSSDLPTTSGAFQTAFGGGLALRSDAFAARFRPDGDALTLDFSTYLGGSGADALTGFVFHPDGTLCTTGSTGSPDFLQQNPLQAVFERLSSAGTVDQGATVTCFTDQPTGTPVEALTGVPTSFALHPNYPNPFNPTTTIPFEVRTQGRVVVEVYDVQGRRLATLVDAVYAPGRYTAQVDAGAWASGVYFYRMRTEHFEKTRKMVFVK